MMRISDLILFLKEYQNSFGDVNVCVINSNRECKDANFVLGYNKDGKFNSDISEDKFDTLGITDIETLKNIWLDQNFGEFENE